MIYQTLLRHRELPVTSMIPRFSGASSLSQTVVPCNLTLTILSVGPNHLNHHLNQSKCKYQCITRKKSPVQPTYNINETPLESCDTEKDLGVWVSSNLTSDKQVTEQCAKANKLLGFVSRASRPGTFKAPKRVVHFIFLSSGAISAMQPKYGRHSPLAY